ncbi:MAG: hypothetical protein ACLQBB_06445 [Solirubrobacteraceae bacterium]
MSMLVKSGNTSVLKLVAIATSLFEDLRKPITAWQLGSLQSRRGQAGGHRPIGMIEATGEPS